MSGKRLWGAVAAVVVLAGLAWYLHSRAAADGPAGSVVTFTVRPGTVQQSISAAASVEQPTTADLAFSAPGRLVSLPVQLGSKVSAGQVIAQEDTSSLQQQVAQQQANLAAGQAKLNQLTEAPSTQQVAAWQAQVAGAKTALSNAQTAYANAQQQYRQGQQSNQLAVTQDQAALANAQTQLKADEATLQTAQTQMANDEVKYGYVNGQPVQTSQMVADEQAVQSDQAAVTKDQQNVQVAQANLAQAQSEAKTPADLQAQLESAQAALRTAQSNYGQAQATYNLNLAPPDPAAVAAAQAAVQQAQATLAAAEVNLSDATLTAPFSGVIGAVNYTVGEMVGGGAPVVTLVNNSPGTLEVQVQVAETDIAQVHVGQSAVFVPDANSNESFNGKVLAVAATATTQANVTFYYVTCSLQGAAGKLVSGMTGTETITTATAQNTLYVPDTAVHLKNGHTEVYLTEQVNGKTVYKHQRIKTGLYNENDIQVLRGLKAGDVIIASGGIPGGKAAAATGFKFGPLGGGGKGGPRGGFKK
ncbi:MAG: efflux RND transporter periplasmic adaptor subunit [Thermaerobacter sp.]|nr:efflux RND transporter periplasmic adaptor subunit [Thermaerobacter sp.]